VFQISVITIGTIKQKNREKFRLYEQNSNETYPNKFRITTYVSPFNKKCSMQTCWNHRGDFLKFIHPDDIES
jgi:hypothetical protein